jgi:hypothetical protein
MAKKQSFIKLAIVALLKAFDAKLEEVKTDAGVVLFAQAFEVDEPVFILEGDTQIPLPIGDYTLEDGRVLSVVAEGIISAITENTGEPAPVMGADGTPMKPAEKSYTISEIKSLIDAGLSEQKKTYEEKLAALEAKLAAIPEPEGIKPNPEGHDTQPVKLAYREKTPIDRVFDKLCES